ncbi:hypothetical protein ACEQPO_06190 [Bacillus sp. SL00103]
MKHFFGGIVIKIERLTETLKTEEYYMGTSYTEKDEKKTDSCL